MFKIFKRLNKNNNLEFHKRPVVVKERSNIIQSDDMGYPLLLCIMSDGSQQWFDVDEKWADDGLKNGTLKLLEWR